MRLTAEATPANPKNGAYGGQIDMPVKFVRISEGCLKRPYLLGTRQVCRAEFQLEWLSVSYYHPHGKSLWKTVLLDYLILYNSGVIQSALLLFDTFNSYLLVSNKNALDFA